MRLLREALYSLWHGGNAYRDESVELIASRIESLEAFAATVRASGLALHLGLEVVPPEQPDSKTDCREGATVTGPASSDSTSTAPGPSAASGGRSYETRRDAAIRLLYDAIDELELEEHEGQRMYRSACRGTGAAPVPVPFKDPPPPMSKADWREAVERVSPTPRIEDDGSGAAAEPEPGSIPAVRPGPTAASREQGGASHENKANPVDPGARAGNRAEGAGPMPKQTDSPETTDRAWEAFGRTDRPAQSSPGEDLGHPWGGNKTSSTSAPRDVSKRAQALLLAMQSGISAEAMAELGGAIITELIDERERLSAELAHRNMLLGRYERSEKAAPEAKGQRRCPECNNSGGDPMFGTECPACGRVWQDPRDAEPQPPAERERPDPGGAWPTLHERLLLVCSDRLVADVRRFVQELWFSIEECEKDKTALRQERDQLRRDLARAEERGIDWEKRKEDAETIVHLMKQRDAARRQASDHANARAALACDLKSLSDGKPVVTALAEAVRLKLAEAEKDRYATRAELEEERNAAAGWKSDCVVAQRNAEDWKQRADAAEAERDALAADIRDALEQFGSSTARPGSDMGRTVLRLVCEQVQKRAVAAEAKLAASEHDVQETVDSAQRWCAERDAVLTESARAFEAAAKAQAALERARALGREWERSLGQMRVLCGSELLAALDASVKLPNPAPVLSAALDWYNDYERSEVRGMTAGMLWDRLAAYEKAKP